MNVTEKRYQEEWNESNFDKELFIMKRSGERVPFDRRKIESAVFKANREMTNPRNQIDALAIETISKQIMQEALTVGRDLSVEEIQDMVENALMAMQKFELARAYITYRYKHNLDRKVSTLDKKIEAIIDVKVQDDGTIHGKNEEVNQENANKDTKIVSVQRDYAAGEWSREYTDKHILPPELVAAHNNGLIHIHDKDFMAFKLHNCFSGDTKFITDKGMRKFKDFKDGDTVIVKDKNGVLRPATVHNYEKQKMQKVILKNNKMEHEVICTPNHRWFLKDGSITTDLKVGDKLLGVTDSTQFQITSKEDAYYFTLGFLLGDGCDTQNQAVRVRLCDNKNKWTDIFRRADWKITHPNHANGDALCTMSRISKQDILNGKLWKYLTPQQNIMMFHGYYAADGSTDRNALFTSDDRLCDFIEYASGLAGYYISSRTDEVHDTPFKKNAKLTTYRFITKTPDNWNWYVKEIKPYKNGKVKTWCVEEPVTHSFMLEKGIITGNCCLINLEDMLQNGTCISGTFIDTPKSFSTAATVASQIIAQVASQQYGGQTISLTHLAPFVNTSRKKIYKRLKQEMQDSGIALTEEQLKAITEKELLKEVESGCQTIQYQLITLQTTNGQAPFVTIFMYLNETKDPVTKKDLALLIEVMLKQRIQGVKNETGAYISPAFPKLIYCLEEDNIHEDAPYWYLTELAAKCSAKRLVPDYISEKQMLKLKGDVYPCMGCVDENEVITYKLFGNLYTESFKRMWNRLADYFEVKLQPNGKDFYMDTPNVEIYDQKVGFVPNHRVIKNHNKEWLTITFSNGRTLTCTPDHPFETENRGVVFAQDLQETDIIQMDNQSAFSTNDISMKENRAWLYGFLLCDSTYYDHVTASIAAESENDIEETFCNICKEEFHLDTNVMKRKRGAKGQYKDLRLQANQENSLSELKMHLIALFEGKAKKDRHIPNEVFCWSKEARLAFLAGMIDADGYVNTNLKLTSVQIGSTNKELAIQQALLAQTLDMPAHIYPNHYRENTKDYVRYRVEFTPTKELLCYMVCRKKTNKPINTIRTNQSICTTNNVSVTNVTAFQKAGYSYDVTTESEHFTVSGLYSHNCRSFLTPDRFTDAGIGNVANTLNYKEGEHKYYGRFNQGVVTINLVDVACSSEGNEDAFWQILDNRLDLCHQALRIRHELLLGTPSDVAPIQWQHGALARLKPGETIDKLLYNGYSTISLGYAGLAETVRYMKDTSHTSEKGKEFGMRVMQALNDACAKWKAEENIDYSVYGTPLESTTYKFAKCLQRRFGKIKGVSDKNYITNSYH